MDIAKPLEHITLSTGAARRSRRSEVAPLVIAAIRTALAKDGALPGGWSVRMIGHPTPAVWVYDLLHQGDRIVSCWLCAAAADSERLWEIVANVPALPGTIVHRPTGVPWLVVAFAFEERVTKEPRFARAMAEVGDLERSVAWALISAD